jgi:tetratricopeptide (TPR) repeat protein
MEEERDFLLRSISDLDREWAARDLAEADYRRLRDGYTARAAAVLRQLQALEGAGSEAGGTAVAAEPPADDPGSTAPSPSSSTAPSPAGVQVAARRGRSRRARWDRGRRRRGLVVLVILCFVAGAGALVVARATHRLPGQTASGTVTLTDDQRLAQQLLQARVLASQGRDLDAIKLYDKVLAVAPRQPEALAYRGWLLRLAGASAHDQSLLAQGRASIDASVAQDPGYPDARAFLGYILFQDARDPVGATEQFRAFLADHPQAQMVALTRDVVAQAFAAVGQPVPPASSPSGPSSPSGLSSPSGP